MPSHEAEQADYAAQAVPLPERNLIDVPVSDIPLPPPDLRDQLDNSDVADADEPEAEDEVATLEFVGAELPEWTHPLRYPFRWEGERHEAVTVHMLTTAEVGRIVGRAAREQKPVDRWDLYAAMTRLPAKVLRALPSVDGDPIVDRCFDFLPPLFRAADG